jgi:hypothetical protein
MALLRDRFRRDRLLPIALPAMLVLGGAALADVRHAEVPEAIRGTWLPAGETCPGPAEKRILLSAKTYEEPGESCPVEWVEERAGTPGTIYSVHIRCGDTAASERNRIFWLKSAPLGVVGTSFQTLSDARLCK